MKSPFDTADLCPSSAGRVCNEPLGVCAEVNDTSSLHCCICPQQQQDFSFTSAGNIHSIFPTQTHCSQQTTFTIPVSIPWRSPARHIPSQLILQRARRFAEFGTQPSCSQALPAQLSVSAQLGSLNDILVPGLISVWSAVTPRDAV